MNVEYALHLIVGGGTLQVYSVDCYRKARFPLPELTARVNGH